MATVTHYIYSHYDPQDSDVPEDEVEQVESDATDPWLTESAFGARRRLARTPRFVAASVEYDPWNTSSHDSGPSVRDSALASPEDLGGWYRSLARKGEDSMLKEPITPHANASPPSPRPTTVSVRPIARDKNSWFIARALAESDGESRSSTATPPHTLADILERDPPPEPSERPFVPPVWLAIGPDNKGFAMLQKSGWAEGEALGRTARRSGIGFKAGEILQDNRIPATTRGGKEIQEVITVEEKEFSYGSDDDVKEVRRVSVIDLSLSDQEEEDGLMANEEDSSSSEAFRPTFVTPAALLDRQIDSAETETGAINHNPTALLTPLPTILKSDRLGIGLKAKRVGPYRESVKRVTHSQAAVAAHVRAGEALQKAKKQVGRGRRGFEKTKRKEESERRRLLAYLNAA